jgi:hypothetical protein
LNPFIAIDLRYICALLASPEGSRSGRTQRRGD